MSISRISSQDNPHQSPFLRLPLELRLAIYEELLAPSISTERVICKCQQCQEKTKGKNCANPKKRERPILPAICQTNKMIHAEATAILYGKNTFQLICSKSTRHANNTRVPEISGMNSLITSKGAPGNAHMKHVNLSFSCYARDQLDDLPSAWSCIEPMVLAHYPSIQQISLHLLRVNVPYHILITMDRKDQRQPKSTLCASHVQNYFHFLKIRPSDATNQMKELCDAVLSAEYPSLFDESAFTVRSVQWSDSRKSRNLEKLTRGIFLDQMRQGSTDYDQSPPSSPGFPPEMTFKV